jgi:hypothetical protein
MFMRIGGGMPKRRFAEPTAEYLGRRKPTNLSLDPDAIVRGEAYAIANDVSITARAAGRDRAARAVGELLELVEVVEVDGVRLRRAMTSGLLDFEDAVQAAAAEACGARCIATGNLRDYCAATVPAVQPGAAMAQFTATDGHPAPHAPPRTLERTPQL